MLGGIPARADIFIRHIYHQAGRQMGTGLRAEKGNMCLSLNKDWKVVGVRTCAVGCKRENHTDSILSADTSSELPPATSHTGLKATCLYF